MCNHAYARIIAHMHGSAMCCVTPKKSLVMDAKYRYSLPNYVVLLTKLFGKYLTTNVFGVPHQIIWLQLFWYHLPNSSVTIT